MVLRKSYKLKIVWRLFLPIAVLLWSIIALLGWYSIYHERELRRDFLETQLRNVNSTVLDAYERGDSIPQLVEFINFFTSNTTLNDMRIAVVDDYGKIIARGGGNIDIQDENQRVIPEIIKAERQGLATSIRSSMSGEQVSMINVMTSNDGNIRTIAEIPYNTNVEHALSYDTLIWLVVLTLAVCATMLAYAIAHKVSIAVSILRKFARRAANARVEDIDKFTFSHDELGDVSREIVKLYIDKDRAITRMEHEHQVAIRANEEQARIKRQSANNINHEIKTPVGVIKGYLDTIVSDPDMPSAVRDSFIRKAQTHADRLTQLLKDVSSITRLDELGSQIEMSVFDFHDLVYNIANDLEVSDINGNLDFEWDVPFDTFVLANYTLVNNAIMNMVRNSAKYSKGTMITLRLLSTDDKFCTFSFADNGTGVGEEHLSKLFDRFYRVDEGRTRKSGGTGLGLPIVKSTFVALGGSVKVQNVDPHGLEIIFTLRKANKSDKTE